jgi:hypothetical protein
MSLPVELSAGVNEKTEHLCGGINKHVNFCL